MAIDDYAANKPVELSDDQVEQVAGGKVSAPPPKKSGDGQHDFLKVVLKE